MKLSWCPFCWGMMLLGLLGAMMGCSRIKSSGLKEAMEQAPRMDDWENRPVSSLEQEFLKKPDSFQQISVEKAVEEGKAQLAKKTEIAGQEDAAPESLKVGLAPIALPEVSPEAASEVPPEASLEAPSEGSPEISSEASSQPPVRLTAVASELPAWEVATPASGQPTNCTGTCCRPKRKVLKLDAVQPIEPPPATQVAKRVSVTPSLKPIASPLKPIVSPSKPIAPPLKPVVSPLKPVLERGTEIHDSLSQAPSSRETNGSRLAECRPIARREQPRRMPIFVDPSAFETPPKKSWAVEERKAGSEPPQVASEPLEPHSKMGSISTLQPAPAVKAKTTTLASHETVQANRLPSPGSNDFQVSPVSHAGDFSPERSVGLQKLDASPFEASLPPSRREDRGEKGKSQTEKGNAWDREPNQWPEPQADTQTMSRPESPAGTQSQRESTTQPAPNAKPPVAAPEKGTPKKGGVAESESLTDMPTAPRLKTRSKTESEPASGQNDFQTEHPVGDATTPTLVKGVSYEEDVPACENEVVGQLPSNAVGGAGPAPLPGERAKDRVEGAPSVAPSLRLTSSEFCREIRGLGQLVTFSKVEFQPTQRVLVYCEVENYQSRPIETEQGARFQTRLQGQFAIFNQAGERVQEGQFPTVEDRAIRKRRYFYLYFPIAFDHLPAGRYRLDLQVTDLGAGPDAAKPITSLSFVVK